MRGPAVAEVEPGAGEELERVQRRRVFTVKGALFVVGLFSGAYVGYSVASQGFDFSAPWSPTACLVLAAVFLAAMAWGSFGLSKSIDEHERQNAYKAAAFAGSAYLVIYPVWFLLWKGGFVGEPIHWALFVLFWLALAGASIYYRFR
jgi:hypothetical protein